MWPALYVQDGLNDGEEVVGDDRVHAGGIRRLELVELGERRRGVARTV